MSAPVVVELVRGEFVESVHRGHVVVLAADGSVQASVGSADTVILPRSAVKFAQAVASLECGADVHDELLALAASSHSGEGFHIDGVDRVLTSVGLDRSALRCPPDLPYGTVAREEWLAAGRGPESVAMNCSGKHATMLAACVASGWDASSYLAPASPLQIHVRAVLERLSGESVRDPEIDGCGAPLFGMTVAGLARMARAVVTAPEGGVERRVADAVRAYPEYASGSGRDVARLMHHVPGLLTKEGAEAVHVGALPDGRAFALKIEDGSMRARTPAVITALRALGETDEHLADLADLEFPDVLGRGHRVGELRSSAELLTGLGLA